MLYESDEVYNNLADMYDTLVTFGVMLLVIKGDSDSDKEDQYREGRLASSCVVLRWTGTGRRRRRRRRRRRTTRRLEDENEE